jgi:WD40 repeat protein
MLGVEPRKNAEFEEGGCVPKAATSLVLSSDGKLVLTGGPVWGIRLFDFATGKEIRLFKGFEGGYARLAFAPDSRRAISYGFSEFIYLWDVETGREIRRFKGGEGGTARAYFTDNGRYIIATGEIDGLIRLLDTVSGEELRSVKVAEKEKVFLDISQSGRHALSLNYDGTACLLYAETGKKLRCFQLAEGKEDLRLSGRHLVLENRETGVLRLVDVDTARESQHTRLLKDSHVEALSEDGRLAIVFVDSGDFKVSFWDLSRGQEGACLETTENENHLLFALTPDGLQVVGGCGDSSLCVWDVKSGKRLRYFETGN